MFLGLSKYILGGVSIFALLSMAWALRLNHLHNDLLPKVDTIIVAIKSATGNQKVNLQGAPQQILALGDEKRQWQEVSKIQTEAINSMSETTRRLKARSDELKLIAEAAVAKRQAALHKLQQMETTPSERTDCESVLREANEALDLVFRESL